MQFSMSQASLPVFEVHLNVLCAILDKAEAYAAAKKIDPAVLLHSRLSPDMFDLARQVQVATDFGACSGAARLAGAGSLEKTRHPATPNSRAIPFSAQRPIPKNMASGLSMRPPMR